MRCPYCADDNSQVKDSRPSEDSSSIRSDMRQYIGRTAKDSRDAMEDSGREMMDKGKELYERGRKVADDAADLFERGKKLVQG